MEKIVVTLLVAMVLSGPHGSAAQCPWSRELVDLHADCICAYNSVQRLSIQCSPVNFQRLMNALHASVQNVPIDLLHVNNCTAESLPDGIFTKLDIQSLHMARCRLKEVSDRAFQGLENSLMSLSLPDNQLTEVPTQALQRLTSLRQLDLSSNRIKEIQSRAFYSLPLGTLKLADNLATIADDAFAGLEGSLKNLNLKGTGQERIPRAVSKLTSLAFLDLAQNKIAKIESDHLTNMHTLTALNLERNRIIKVDANSFSAVNDTLSSLSLLNNLLVEFPIGALATLTELRVFDLGFNGIRSLPNNAFQNNPFLTLLALDGNPISTIPIDPFRRLNTTLRALSIGGPYLMCDCQVRWIAEWIANKDLQVSSRERNPQFCGKPEHLKRKQFSQIPPSDFICNTTTTAQTVISTATTTTVAPTSTAQTTTQGSKEPLPSSSRKDLVAITVASETTEYPATLAPAPASSPSINAKRFRPSSPSPRSASDRTTKNAANISNKDVKLIEAYKKDSSIVLEWESNSSQGFQVVYRLFGERMFRRGPSVQAGQRKYALQSLPTNRCLVVCIVQDSSDITLENISQVQCRELKLESFVTAHLDKIIIASSAAVCGIIILAVIIFLCCWRKKQSKDPNAKSRLPPPTSMVQPPIKAHENEWETMSMYSSRSIPRARMYHMDNINGSTNQSFVIDDARSNISHLPHLISGNGYTSKARSTADGQSHRSYSQMSNKYRNGLGNPDIRKSQQSLSALSGTHSFLDAHTGTEGRPVGKRKQGGRLASASSMHSLTEYDTDWNGRTENWKDNEVGIYVGQNHVAPTHGKYHHR